ncbi:MAG: acetyl-CoA C-acetyltransferase [Deltaproteobacteria bacterium]|nr:MAG: acetyl-CoA C-acetyltransferase [Deltaproteobacteria bacterium]
MADCFIYDAVRTPRGKGRASGSLHTIAPIDLAKTVLTAVVDRNELDSAVIEDVILGCVEPVKEQGGNIARVAALYAGYDQSVPGMQINRFCASGLVATNYAAARVMSGQSEAVVGGGLESMSRVPMGASRGPWATDPAVASETMFVPQGISADLIATLYGYSRRELDELSARSQDRAALAWKEGRFAKSIVPVKDMNGITVLDHDEHMRPGTTAESLGKLKASFTQLGEQYGFDAIAMQRYPQVERIEHVHHAGNSSGIVDGAAAILLGSKELGERFGLKPRARIKGFASIGSEPTIMLTGPADAARRALKKAGMGVGDIDLWEINEAFAAVVMRFAEDLGLDHDIVNVNGGAIAMGHPLGATGAMILGTLLDELERTGKSTGVAALCVGAGMGTATVIERVEA